ncbi:MAG TPA: hypothetical protein VHX86_11365 [Tepidisphaeraceae bacterium]|jgi:hypothetical protein|nr:hypothetical protein [Tepidisphaeraceae bacterium]
MGFRNVVNDGSSNPPRLRFQQCTSSMAGESQGSAPEFLNRMAGAGFSGFEAHCQSEQNADELAAMLRERGLAIGYSAVGAEADDLLAPLELAHRMRADYLSVRVTGSLKSSPQIAHILKEMYDLVNDAGLPLFIETHGASVTQDLRRTVKVVKRFKKVRLTGDVSHYAAVGEFGPAWSEDVWDHFQRIADRSGNWHGRLGDDAASSETAQQFKRLWTIGFGAWLKKARPGDVLPFCCESATGAWEHTLAIKGLAEEGWADALAEQRARDAPAEIDESPAPADIAADPGMH